MTGTINLGLTLIKGRRSIREFKPDQIEDYIISNTLEAARYAPTARNVQPWLIGVVKDKEKLQKLSDMTQSGKFIKDANVCFAVFAKKDHEFYLEDASACTLQIMLALWSYGVGSCWVAGDKKPYIEDARKLLNVPEKYTLVALIPAGYPADVKVPVKKERDEISFNETYSED